MNSTPVFVCEMFYGIDPLRWNGILVIRQFSKIPCHIAKDKDM